MSTEPRKLDIVFPNGNRSKAVEVDRDIAGNAILDALHLPRFPRAVIPISGGAKYLSANGFSRIYTFVDAVVELAFEQNIMLVDGGTDTGIMRVVGKHFGFVRLQNPHSEFPPLVGFVPLPLVKLPDQECSAEDDFLESHHPYFILVRNASVWGEEVETMFSLVNTITKEKEISSVSLIVNGGLTTLKEAVLNIRSGREIVVLDGGHRATKLIFAALEGQKPDALESILLDKEENLVHRDAPDWEKKLQTAQEQLSEIASYEKISGFNHDRKPADLKDLLSAKLGLGH